jgi:hypothetical protein
MAAVAGPVLYDDRLVKLDQTGITLRYYYFPLGLSKHIAYAHIRQAHRTSMGLLTGKGRLWGSGDLRHWAPLDVRRPSKDTAIVLDLGKPVQPVFSPDDPGQVLTILREHIPASAP